MELPVKKDFFMDSISLPCNTRYGIRFTAASLEQPFSLHYHDHYEIFYSLSGSIVYTIGAKQYQLEPGTLLLIPPWELHRPCVCPGVSYERVSIRFCEEILELLSTADCNLALCFQKKEGRSPVLFRVEPENQKEFLNLCRGFWREFRQDSWGKKQAELAWLTQIFVFINRMAQRESGVSALSNPSLKRIQQVIEYIEHNYGQPLSLTDLEKKFYVNKAYLSREFNRLVGCSPHRYLMQKRLMHAQQFLREGLPPQSTADKCGFKDYTNFYRQFRAMYGAGPREYQKQITRFE